MVISFNQSTLEVEKTVTTFKIYRTNSSRKMEKEIKSVLKYFSFFAYYPTSEEIYTFLQAKISRNSFNKELKKMVSQKKILDTGSLILDEQRYTVGEYSKNISNIKYQISKKKLRNLRFRLYLKLVSLFPQIKLVGLSGSISMMNADLDHDVDLFIITKKNRLFTGRFLATMIAFIMGLKRPLGLKKASDKVCLNLFFDESNLKVPKFKQTLFVGHEVLQMKPIINKDYVYERFLVANGWIFKLFPNAIENLE